MSDDYSISGYGMSKSGPSSGMGYISLYSSRSVKLGVIASTVNGGSCSFTTGSRCSFASSCLGLSSLSGLGLNETMLSDSSACPVSALVSLKESSSYRARGI